MNCWKAMGNEASGEKLSLKAISVAMDADPNVRNVAIDFTGESSSPVGFALLNGLQPGRNWLWNLSATRQLGQYLQLNLSYEGRQTGMAKTVHVGRAQVTALF